MISLLFCLLSACGHSGLVDEGMSCYASMVTDYIISAKLEHYTFMVKLLGCAGHLQRIWSWQCPVNHMWLHGWLCSVLAEFVVMWRCQNVLPNEFLKWSLTILLVMCCCQTSTLLLATGFSVIMLNDRERKKGVKKQLGHT